MKSSNLAERLDAFEQAPAPAPRKDVELRVVRTRPRPSASFRARQRARFGQRTIEIRDQGFQLFRVV